jgi:hypothetical protein
MKDRNKLIIGITSLVVTVGLIIFLAGRKQKKTRLYRLERIADEGYETAGDILFPGRYTFKRQRTAFN